MPDTVDRWRDSASDQCSYHGGRLLDKFQNCAGKTTSVDFCSPLLLVSSAASIAGARDADVKDGILNVKMSKCRYERIHADTEY